MGQTETTILSPPYRPDPGRQAGPALDAALDEARRARRFDAVAEAEPIDLLAPARGIVVATLLAVPFWAGLLLATHRLLW